jgi:transposase, IS30 family
MKQYSRVSYEQRCQIYAFLQVKLSIPEIARRLSFNKSTIYREISRNKLQAGYLPRPAQEEAQKRY